MQDKTILITGASSGIGRETAVLLSRRGARTVLLARRAEQLEETRKLLHGGDHACRPFDLSVVEEIPAMMKSLGREYGPFSGLFHCAGAESVCAISAVKKNRIEDSLNATVAAACMLAKGFSRKSFHEAAMTSIVLMSSAAGTAGQKGMSLYSAAKAAIEGLCRSLACELAGQKIRVNCIAAGAVQTAMHRRLVANMAPDGVAEYEKKHLLGFGTPRNIADAALFLLSDASSWITGTSLVVDGGYLCR